MNNDRLVEMARVHQLLQREPPVARMVDENADEAGVAWPPAAGRPILGRNADTISSLLFDMIREECACKSVLSGWEAQGCQKHVDQCTEWPDQAFYVHRQSGRTPLHEACLRSACSHVIKALLNANPISSLGRDFAGHYPIHLIFIGHRYSDLDEMQEVIEALLSVNPTFLAISVNYEISTPLDLACRLPIINGAIIAKLIQANPTCAALLNNHMRTPLHVYVEFGEHHDLEGARCILDAHPGNAHTQDQDGRTPLHMAAARRNTAMLCFLLEYSPEVARMRDNSGRTALHELCDVSPREEHLPAIRALVEAAPETLLMTELRLEQTPLHCACSVQRPSLETIKLLATRDAASKTDAEHYTALHYACEGGADVGIIQFLLSVYDMAACVTTRKQDTALHIACGKNTSNDTVRLLIEANPAALNMTNDYGFTPLHCVCRAYQPRLGIVHALLEACPSSIIQRTNGGETAVHLACSSGAFVGVLQMLTLAQNQMSENVTFSISSAMLTEGTTNKIGNSPLHEACFRGASFEHIETLAKATPEWIVVRNNAGYTPLQVMCKSGRLDERVVTAFSRIRGHEVFSVMDSAGHTPLHSACREGTSIAAIRSLIQAFPDALHLKTTYGDTPLHLSCLRRASADVVEEIAVSSFGERTSTLLATNTAGQTPIGIAMGEFHTMCIGEMGCGIAANYTTAQHRAFDVLAVMVKLLFYGASSYGGGPRSLVKACVCLHRRGIRLNPTFIRRAIDLYPDEVRQVDDDFNHPLHIEASIPVEKMSLLDGPARNCCGRKCYSRAGVLSSLLAVYPEATQVQNSAGEFPLGLMIQNGRSWDQTFAMTLRHFPPALHWYKGMDVQFIPYVLSKVSRDCGLDTIFHLINSRPEMVCP